MTKHKQLQGNLFLFVAAFIWGFAFVAQRFGMDHTEPFMFNGLRFLLGAAALIPVILIFDRLESRRAPLAGGSDAQSQAAAAPKELPSSVENAQEVKRASAAATRKGGLLCGLILFAGASLQQVGLVYTSAGKTAFITALYIVLVPFFSIILKHKVGLNAWFSAAIAAVGLYLLCIKEGFAVEFGDLIILISAVFWTFHILVVDHFVARVNAIKMSAYQFLIVGVLSLLISFIFEVSTLSGIADAALAIVFTGIFSSSIGFTLQILGQKHAAPTAASLILSMEAVFGAIGGYLLLNELLSAKELLGCALMFSAVILSQLPVKTKERI